MLMNESGKQGPLCGIGQISERGYKLVRKPRQALCMIRNLLSIHKRLKEIG
jgi:hypothetical protein